MSDTSLDVLIFNNRTKTKMAMLAFLYYGEFMKNSIVRDQSLSNSSL